jgi:hypothetical protein
LSSWIPYTVSVEDDWEYDPEKNLVWIDNENVSLYAYPAYLHSSGWVEFNVTSKHYSGDVDLAFGFEDNESKAKRLQIWKNYSHTLYRWVEANKSGETIFYNISDPQNLGIENYDLYDVDIGNRWNNYLYNFTGSDGFETRNWTVAWLSPPPNQINFSEQIIEYNYTGWEKEFYESWFYDWKDVTGKVDVEHTVYRGMNIWYLVEHEIQNETQYRFRIYVDLPFKGFRRVEGKWSFGIKPSNKPIKSDTTYILDPWYDQQWLNRTKLTFDNTASSENLENFTVLVHLNDTYIDWAHVQDDGDDIRFTDSDAVTLLDAELEKWDDTNDAWMWVKVPQIDSGVDTDYIYMYYNNAGASSYWDAENTWDSNYVGVWHMNDNDTSTILDSTSNDNDGTKKGVNEPIETTSGQIDSAQSFDGTDDYIDLDDPATLEIGTQSWTFTGIIYPKNVTSQYVIYAKYGTGLINYFEVKVKAGQIAAMVRDGDGDNIEKSKGIVNIDTWYFVSIVWNATSHSLEWFIDGSSIGSGINVNIGNVANSGEPAYIGRYRGGTYFNGTIDETRCSDTARSADWIEASYLSMTEAYITFGSEEAPSPPTNDSLVYTSVFSLGVDGWLNITVSEGAEDEKNTSLFITQGTTLRNATVDYVWSTDTFTERTDDNDMITLDTSTSDLETVDADTDKACFKLKFLKQVGTSVGNVTATTYDAGELSDTDVYQDVIITEQGISTAMATFMIAGILLSFIAIVLLTVKRR